MIKPTLRQMQYFETLVQTLHFGRAAVLCGISQPALSAQIADMEEKLGCKLFDRSGRNAILTPEALTLLPLIARALAATRDVEEAAMAGRGALEGRFRLGIIPTVAPYLLPSILPQLRQRYPELRLELREAVTDTLAEETALGSLDAFIAALPLDQPGLTAEALFEDRFFLAVPADDPHLVAPPIAPESATRTWSGTDILPNTGAVMNALPTRTITNRSAHNWGSIARPKPSMRYFTRSGIRSKMPIVKSLSSPRISPPNSMIEIATTISLGTNDKVCSLIEVAAWIMPRMRPETSAGIRIGAAASASTHIVWFATVRK